MDGFTEKEVKLLQASHEELAKDPKAMTAVFLEYFRQYPHNQGFFPFRNVPLDQLADDTDFQIQCTMVLSYTTACISNLDNLDVVEGILIRLGRSHRKYRIPVSSFWESAKVIVEGISKLVDEETHKAYAKYWKFVVETVLTGMGK